jgi:DNA-binding NarL/FixJ family response regulator
MDSRTSSGAVTDTVPAVAVEADPAAPRIRVAVADDNAVVRMGIRSLLATADDLEVVGEAGDGAAAVALVRAKHPDVLLLDVRMPKQDGVTTAVAVAAETAVLMLTYSDSPEVISAAVRGGARGYLVHGHFSEVELIQSVRMVARGLGTFSAQAVAALTNPAPSRDRLAAQFGLSEREAEVMQLIAEGAANCDIAAELFISEKTVKNHINRIFTKLGAHSRGHAVSLWLGSATR